MRRETRFCVCVYVCRMRRETGFQTQEGSSRKILDIAQQSSDLFAHIVPGHSEFMVCKLNKGILNIIIHVLKKQGLIILTSKPLLSGTFNGSVQENFMHSIYRLYLFTFYNLPVQHQLTNVDIFLGMQYQMVWHQINFLELQLCHLTSSDLFVHIASTACTSVFPLKNMA